MQSIELSIRVKKVVYRGIKCYEVLDYSGYDYEQLPEQYFDNNPICVINKGLLNVVITDTEGYTIGKGQLIDEKTFNKILRNIKYCGKKLHDINVIIKELKQEWKGEEVIKI